MGVSPSVVSSEVWHDIAARAVHESNWQEGIFVDRGKTKELALHVFEVLDKISGPHLDIDRIVEHHKRHLVTLKRKQIPIEEIAAYNLSAAHRRYHGSATSYPSAKALLSSMPSTSSGVSSKIRAWKYRWTPKIRLSGASKLSMSFSQIIPIF
jgi:hypothetical protein